MADESGKSGIEDSAEDKLVSQGEQLHDANKEKNEVKYTCDIQNGETKMDCDMRRAFVGMSKDELMKFANDPFWVLTRQFLFALFWIMWVAMLIGSVAIVVTSPKCTSSQEPWFRHALVYKFDIRAYEHGALRNRIGHLKSMKDHLHYFQYLGVDSILIESLMECTSNSDNDVKDFKKIDSAFGSFEILKDLTGEMKKKGIRLTMSFDPNYSSDKHEWFRNSIAKIKPFTDYYVWAHGSFSSDDNSPVPPNNWLSLNGSSAWTYVKERDQFYLHQFLSHQPDLNFRQHDIVEYFKQVLDFWSDYDLSGFHINGAKYLVEDVNLSNETINPAPGTTHQDYQFYSHSRTTDDPLTVTIVNEWSRAVQPRSTALSVNDFYMNDLDSNLIVYFTMKICNSVNATEFNDGVQTNLQRSFPTWQWECLGEWPDERTAKGLISIFILLPGTAVIQGGEELSWPTNSARPWSSNGTPRNNLDYFLNTTNSDKTDPKSYLNMLTKLTKLRKKEAFSSGTTEHTVLNSTVFAFTRVHSDQGYLIGFNFDDLEKSLNLDTFKDISTGTELSLILFWNKDGESVSEEKSDLLLTIPGKTLVVYHFSVPTVVSSS